jgi:hypothetical protein
MRVSGRDVGVDIESVRISLSGQRESSRMGRLIFKGENDESIADLHKDSRPRTTRQVFSDSA